MWWVSLKTEPQEFYVHIIQYLQTKIILIKVYRLLEWDTSCNGLPIDLYSLFNDSFWSYLLWVNILLVVTFRENLGVGFSLRHVSGPNLGAEIYSIDTLIFKPFAFYTTTLVHGEEN